jgi:hypothetical protein
MILINKYRWMNHGMYFPIEFIIFYKLSKKLKKKLVEI